MLTASDLFVEQGYGRTTIADIAPRGVSVETIYGAFGNKPTLLHKAWDVTVGGDDQDIVFHERPEVLAIRNEPDLVKRLMLHAAFSTRTVERIARSNSWCSAREYDSSGRCSLSKRIGRLSRTMSSA